MDVSSFDNKHRLAVEAYNQALENLRTAIDQENEESPFLAQSRKLAIETFEARKIASDRLQKALLLQNYNNKMKRLIQQ